MDHLAKWIWLDKSIYPNDQTSEITYFDPQREKNPFVTAEFKLEKHYEKTAVKAEVSVSADVTFRLFMNGNYVGNGPACAGGDYGSTTPMPKHYYNTYTVSLDSETVEFYVLVQKNIIAQLEMSQGRPGMILSAEIEFADGSKETVVSDRHWLARKDLRRYTFGRTDFTVRPDEWHFANEIGDERVLKAAPIAMLAEEKILPPGFAPITVNPGEIKTVEFEFEKIYSCYYHLNVSAESECMIQVTGWERVIENAKFAETVLFDRGLDFRGAHMTSIGNARLYIVNSGKKPVTVNEFSLCFEHYPVEQEGSFVSSDANLNKIYDMGKWALKICRQTIELDSPLHLENLGCTGDYMIASLMNYFVYGDPKLTRFDIVRTADYMVTTGGYMFHTTYSMMWIFMLYDYYTFTADKAIFAETKEALITLLERFHSYTDERGIITHPESYMFLDWLTVDGFSLHHPPAALGQAALNAFYAGGLATALKIFEITGDDALCKKYSARLAMLKQAYSLFYDEDRQLYFDGLNEDYEVKKFIPENPKKRYFSLHTNTLAVLYDLVPEEQAAALLTRALEDQTITQPQPYFMHFVMEAIYKAGLFGTYGLPQLRRWTAMTEFEKGLQEGWYAMGGYGFDYSHVWGGTPTYQLPSKLMGFTMVKPGFEEISLHPKLYDLDDAAIEMPTPYGMITVAMKRGEEPKISVPSEIKLTK